MPDPVPELSGSTVVILGSMNPAIFHPSWFARQNLITPAEADSPNTKIAVTHEQVSQFETESFVVQVTPERFTATTKPNTHWIVLRDLVIGTFYVLEHIPVKAMGINRGLHYRVPDEESWHRLGDRLAPKNPWGEVLGGRPGMATLEILAKRDDADVQMRVKVQPSVRVLPHGVFFETNEHYVAPENDGLRHLLDILRERWEPAQAYAGRIANHILNWAGRDADE